MPVWVVQNKAGEQLRITVEDIEHDSSHELGVDPGLVKDGVEAHLQVLLAEHVELLGAGYTLVRREYMTPIGPVDLLCRDDQGRSVAVEIKRRGEIDGVEQLTRYLELLNRDSLLAPVSGVFAAQQIKPQARTLATDRGIRCLTLDYDQMRGMDSDEFRLVLSCFTRLVSWLDAAVHRVRQQSLPPLPRRVGSRLGPTGTTTRCGRSPARERSRPIAARGAITKYARAQLMWWRGWPISARWPSKTGGTGTRRAGPTGQRAGPTQKVVVKSQCSESESVAGSTSSISTPPASLGWMKLIREFAVPRRGAS